jgi:hypothetical protein
MEVVMSEKKKEVRKINMRVSGGSLPKDFSVIIPVEMDFTGSTRDELIEWAIGDRRVAAQRWLRSKTPEYLQELTKSELQVHAREAGHQLKSREDRIKELVTAGVPQAVAEAVVDDPSKLEKMLNG